MTTDDLIHIFQEQMSAQSPCLLHFVLVDGDHETIGRHPSDDMDTLLLTLDCCFQYDGIKSGLPRFKK
jgi:hypothetical protein